MRKFLPGSPRSFLAALALAATLALAAPALGQQAADDLPDLDQLRLELNRREAERAARSESIRPAAPAAASGDAGAPAATLWDSGASDTEAPAAGMPDERQLRHQLNRMETERRGIEANRPFGWEENFRPFELKFDASKDRENGVVELRYEAREVPCFVMLEREGGAKATAVQAPMVIPGSQWVRVAEGTWNVRLFAGYATGPVVEFASSPVEIEAGKVYQLMFGTEEELAARDMLRDAVRARNEQRAERSVRAFR